MPMKKAREHTKKAVQLRRDSRTAAKYGYPAISKELGTRADANSDLAARAHAKAKKAKK